MRAPLATVNGTDQGLALAPYTGPMRDRVRQARRFGRNTAAAGRSWTVPRPSSTTAGGEDHVAAWGSHAVAPRPCRGPDPITACPVRATPHERRSSHGFRHPRPAQ